jgi:hypothetical protein
VTNWTTLSELLDDATAESPVTITITATDDPGATDTLTITLRFVTATDETTLLEQINDRNNIWADRLEDLIEVGKDRAKAAIADLVGYTSTSLLHQAALGSTGNALISYGGYLVGASGGGGMLPGVVLMLAGVAVSAAGTASGEPIDLSAMDAEVDATYARSLQAKTDKKMVLLQMKTDVLQELSDSDATPDERLARLQTLLDEIVSLTPEYDHFPTELPSAEKIAEEMIYVLVPAAGYTLQFIGTTSTSNWDVIGVVDIPLIADYEDLADWLEDHGIIGGGP